MENSAFFRQKGEVLRTADEFGSICVFCVQLFHLSTVRLTMRTQEAEDNSLGQIGKFT